VKKVGAWTSVYSAVPNLPASVLRGAARFAGAHIYRDAADVLYATPLLLGVHTIGGGPRTFRLREPAEIVYDLFERREIARGTGAFSLDLPPASTSLFYTGPAAVLGKLRP
jgi:hypothetical protein